MSVIQHPVWAMAFRPLYPLAAVYGAFSVLLWAFGYQGTVTLPSYFWHAHEMIWGYAGAVVVAFLLTAVATWTGQPPTRGKPLLILVVLWLLARIFAFTPFNAVSGFFGVAFYWLAAVCMGVSVVRSRNSRNYIAVAALFLFGLMHLLFHLNLSPFNAAALLNGLLSGLVMVAGFIGLIGTRIISFFTSRRLGTPQVASPMWLALSALVLPMVAALLMSLQTALPLASLCSVAAGVIGLVQTCRWFEKGTLREPLLWILFAGYTATSIGLIVIGTAYWQPQIMSTGVHLVAVGGIGMLTVGMMARTALGHTGRPLYPAPQPMGLAFLLMLAATVMRTLAAFAATVNATAYNHSLRLSAALFAASLLLYAWRYTPWLLRPRLDGKAG
ncbi:MAG: NnrS family protein [Neisseria sp.]|uniref:NnrS family protein n=1 Tax=Neisseria sp. TaxID=192066 RepID=UPI0026DD6982|nr:NnrS family protein [Neisseria sp.]MDO4641151.1 NnrS family protein [Neisseria sp.]